MAARTVARGTGRDTHTISLFQDLPAAPPIEKGVNLRNFRHPVWTENKAKLIARYLQLFTFVTKHGTYIDGFAGQQSQHAKGGWAAELVLGLKPRRLRQFYLCDKGQGKLLGLEKLVNSQPPKEKNDAKRSVEVFSGDFNQRIHEILNGRKLEKAAFCLLDPHTFECQWSTVEALAKHRQSGLKIELFYFLAVGWLNRAMHATTKNKAQIQAWWGRPDWEPLLDMQHLDKALAFCNRFHDLGYKYVLPLPIFDNQQGNRIMFYMILASDHPDAPKLMWRAYDQAVHDVKGWDQLELLKS